MICALFLCRIYNNINFVGIYLYIYFWASTHITQQQHHLTILLFYRPHTENTEIQSTVGGRLIVVREIVTQIYISWLQLIFGNKLLHPISARNLSVLERGVFCIAIVDIILIRALLGLVCYVLAITTKGRGLFVTF